LPPTAPHHQHYFSPFIIVDVCGTIVWLNWLEVTPCNIILVKVVVTLITLYDGVIVEGNIEKL
jgi:hypothetical protein